MNIRCEIYEYIDNKWEIAIPEIKELFNCSEIFEKIIQQYNGIMEVDFESYYGKFQNKEEAEKVEKLLNNYFKSIEKITKLYFLEDGIRERIGDIVNPYLVMDRLIE